MTIVYRIQPRGAELHGVKTEASDGTIEDGVHVFTSLQQVYACREWCTERRVELVKIECTASDLQPNGDYEGDLLRSGRGKIVARKPFADTKKISAWVDGREEW